MKTQDRIREERLDELVRLRRRVHELGKSEAERKRLEYTLSKRVRELQCLYDINRIAEQPDITLDQLYQKVVNLLPVSWQYPDIACAQITIYGKTFQAREFRDSEWKQSSDIKLRGDKAGVLEVRYLEEKPEVYEGPFLKEERSLLNAVAERLGKITERREAEETIKKLAYYDKLTGLPNRVLFNDRIEMALAQARRYEHKLAVLLLDLDEFKDINDRLGHKKGDQVLQMVANRLSNLLRATDVVTRLGGDEFLVLLTHIRHDQDVIVVTQKIMKAIDEPFILDGHECNITVSIGIAVYPKHGTDAGTLIERADVAMYRAKEGGRNQWQWYAGDISGESS